MKSKIINNIGKGLIFPIELLNGKPVLHTGDILIKSSIANILQWPILTREYEMKFGTIIPKVLEEPITPQLANSLRYTVKDSLSKYEKRIKVISVELFQKSQETISIYIKYQIKLDKSEETLILDV